jgi:hypothetical protein
MNVVKKIILVCISITAYILATWVLFPYLNLSELGQLLGVIISSGFAYFVYYTLIKYLGTTK